MKKLFTLLLSVAIMFCVTMVTAKQAPDQIDKGKIEVVAEAPVQLALEHKEAYKVDDGEYKGFVITNAGFSGTMVASGIGILAVLSLIVGAFKRGRIKRTQLNIGCRLLIASVILFFSKGSSPLAGMVLAGIVMAFPSFKSWATQKRYSRLAEGEQDDEDEDDAELKAIKKIGEQVDGFKKLLGDKADKEQFTALEATINELKEGLKTLTGAKVIEKMGEINTKLQEVYEDVQKAKDNTTGGGNTAGKPMFTKKDVEDFVNATFKDGRKTTDAAAIKINSSLVLKAAETFGYGAFFNGGADTDQSAFTGRMVDPTLYQKRRKRNLILDHFAIESITVPKLIYLEKKEVAGAGDSGSNEEVGGADWIASGGEKPKRSFRVTTGEVTAKKLAIFGTLEDKLLRDVPSLENWIREDFMDEMRETYNDGLLNNNPGVDADAPLGLKTNAIQFSATAAFDESVTNPQYVDMIIAAAAKMADLKEQPGKAFISADVWYRIFSLKDENGKYLHPDLVYVAATNTLYLAGIELVPCDSEDVPSTHLLMTAVDPGFKIKNYGPMVFERGLNSDDFRHDRTSYRGYQEVLSYIPEHRENTVMYDTWANIEAAITAPIAS